jgi:hypothetical protein
MDFSSWFEQALKAEFASDPMRASHWRPSYFLMGEAWMAALAAERERCAGLVEKEASLYYSGHPLRQDLLRLLEKIRQG